MTRSDTFALGLIDAAKIMCAQHDITYLNEHGGTAVSLALYRANGSTTVVVSREGESGTMVLYGPATLPEAETFLSGLVQGIRASTIGTTRARFLALRAAYDRALDRVEHAAPSNYDSLARAERDAYDALAEFASEHGLCYQCGRPDDTEDTSTRCSRCTTAGARS
jgi:hypothetical protein